MKYLELVYGFINLNACTCVEVGIEKDHNNLHVCRIYTDPKNIMILSFEAKEDAIIFSKHLWKRILHFMHDSEESFMQLRKIIQEALQEAEKEL